MTHSEAKDQEFVARIEEPGDVIWHIVVLEDAHTLVDDHWCVHGSAYTRCGVQLRQNGDGIQLEGAPDDPTCDLCLAYSNEPELFEAIDAFLKRQRQPVAVPQARWTRSWRTT